jgi:hypothetical protein
MTIVTNETTSIFLWLKMMRNWIPKGKKSQLAKRIQRRPFIALHLNWFLNILLSLRNFIC